MPQSTRPRGDYRQWTEDTRIAFLLALRLHGGVTRAAAAIGRVRDSCYGMRKRDPAFAAQWDAILSEQIARRRTARSEAQAAARARVKAARALDASNPGECDASGNRRRWTGLTQVKRRAFLRALSETGTVAAACRAADVSDTAAYRLRGDDADFASAWDRALRTAAPALEQVAWERAVEGWEETVWRGGAPVGTRRRYSETLLRQLIVRRDREAEHAASRGMSQAALIRRAEAAAVAAGGAFVTYASREETNAAIIAKLKKLEYRLGLPPLEPAGAPAAGAPADEAG